VRSSQTYIYGGQRLARFSAPRYRWPSGFGYEHYVVGHELPRQFIVRDYYIDDYAAYGFDAPPPDFEWVRYGPDAVLLDLTSGLISQVIYGAFDESDDGQDASADAPPDQ
jgi:Ni/Co efflux regulator RcnB